jgi:hypothetical protein
MAQVGKYDQVDGKGRLYGAIIASVGITSRRRERGGKRSTTLPSGGIR